MAEVEELNRDFSRGQESNSAADSGAANASAEWEVRYPGGNRR